MITYESRKQHIRGVNHCWFLIFSFQNDPLLSVTSTVIFAYVLLDLIKSEFKLKKKKTFANMSFNTFTTYYLICFNRLMGGITILKQN